MTEFTGSEFIKDIVNEISTVIYVELIVVDKILIVIPSISTGSCGQVCNIAVEFPIIRELFDPADLNNGCGTIRSALCFKGRSVEDYTVYLRDFVSNTLRLVDISRPIRNRMSIVAIHNSLTDGELRHVLNHIRTHREILPMRMT